jgi:hypothetical protein
VDKKILPVRERCKFFEKSFECGPFWEPCNFIARLHLGYICTILMIIAILKDACE